MSEYLAVTAFYPALRQTAGRFWPPRRGQLIRLFIISFFLGTWITSPVPKDLSYTDLPFLADETTCGLVTEHMSLIASVLIAFLIILLIYALISSVFQFIFVDYLSAKTQCLLPSFKARAGMGIRLLSFYIITIGIIGILAGIALIAIASPILAANPDNPAQLLVALIWTLAGLLILIIPVWIATIITNDFVVPVMIVHNCGILRGWRIIIQQFSGKWDETAIYLLIKIMINVIAGAVLGLLLVVIGDLMGFSSLVFIPGMTEAKPVSLTGLLIPFLVMALVTFLVMTPVITFLRYYALIFLERISQTYSLLPDVFSSR